MTAPACMGGNCPRRESCSYYHSDSLRPPSERLCEAGTFDAWQTILSFKTKKTEVME